MTALASAGTLPAIEWSYFADEIVSGGDWDGEPGYAMLWSIEHAGHAWITDRRLMIRSDLLPPLEALAEAERPAVAPFTPSPDNDVLARLDDPTLPSRHAHVEPGPALFEAGLLAPLLVGGLTVGTAPDRRLPHPVLLHDLVVGLLMPVRLDRGYLNPNSVYVTEVSPFLRTAHAALADSWAGAAGVCDRQVWNAAAALENSGRFITVQDRP